MLEVALAVRDGGGRVIDPAALGVDALVEVIRARPPSTGPGAVDRAREVAVFGPAMLSLEAVERLSRQVAALRVACVAAVADETPGGAGTDRVVDEVSCALVVSRRSAQHTRASSELVRHEPGVWAALARGEVDLTRARVLAGALLEVPAADPDGIPRDSYEADHAGLLAAGLGYAAEHTARRLDLFLQRRLAALGCPTSPCRRRQALAERGVWLGHRGDGTADLVARLASPDAERVYAAIRGCALADRNGDPAHDRADPREPLDLWLATALVDLVLDPGRTCAPAGVTLTGGTGNADATGDLRPDRTQPDRTQPDRTQPDRIQPDRIQPDRIQPDRIQPDRIQPDRIQPDRIQPGRTGLGRPVVGTVITVTIPVDSLAGLTDTPGVINGFGVIPAEDARRLAAGDARWRHVLTCNTSGAVLDVGTLSYRPPAALARHVRLRDGTCRFPGCAVPAAECDLDHLIPFPQGPTSAANLHALCRRHHGLKHDSGWHVQGQPGNALRWTSPQGATASSHPDDTHAHVA